MPTSCTLWVTCQKMSATLYLYYHRKLRICCISGMHRHVHSWAWQRKMGSFGEWTLWAKMSISGLSCLRLMICKCCQSITHYSCWIESVKEIMQSYTEKTDVAFIEEKESMIVWNYKDSDPEFGNWQAKELTSHLEHVFCNLPIEIV